MIEPSNRPPTPVPGFKFPALQLGLAHAVVDAGCAYVLFRDLSALPRSTAVALIVAYNCVAFAGQAPAGALADRFRLNRSFAVAGLALVALGLQVAPALPFAAVFVVAGANALFHVGAGAEVLARSGERSAEGGIFVGPGAVGLFAGVWLGTAGVDARAALFALALGAVPFALKLVAPRMAPPDSAAAPSARALPVAAVATALLCLFGSVVVRSLAGGAANGAWKAIDPSVLLWLAVAAFAGKALGGLVADKLGWALTSTAALLVGAPLLSYLLRSSAAAAVLGMFLLQSTMPVTLKATHLLMPRRPGLAFGIPCLALVTGALIGYLPAAALRTPWFALAATLASAALVVVALANLGRGAQDSIEPASAAPPVEPAA